MAAILIIDPDMPTRNRIQEALETANHRCITADNAAEGYEIAQHSTRMLVILNARLPWAESFTLLRLLEEKAALCHGGRLHCAAPARPVPRPARRAARAL